MDIHCRKTKLDLVDQGTWQYCMARLLSKQDDFLHQPTMLETVIKAAGHEIIFLPKFHCELNPIEMVSEIYHAVNAAEPLEISTGAGVSTSIGRLRSGHLSKPKLLPCHALMHAQMMCCVGSSTGPGDSSVHTDVV